MRVWTAMLGVGLAVGAARAGDVSWTAGVPLWKGLSAGGKLVEAGPAPGWSYPGGQQEPAARLGPIQPASVRPAPAGTPRLLPLPADVMAEPGPTILPFPRVVGVLPTAATAPARPFGREALAPAAHPTGPDSLLPPVRSVFRPIQHEGVVPAEHRGP